MDGKSFGRKSWSALFIALFLFIRPFTLLSDNNKPAADCVDKSIERIRIVESLPEKKYLHTLAGQHVLLYAFYTKCLSLVA